MARDDTQTQMSDELPHGELERRVLYSLMRAVVRLAKVFRISLEDIQGLLQMAYFNELRTTDGLTLLEVAELLSVSRRSAARMSKQLKTNFFRPEREHELPRRILFMLWAESMSRARIVRELRDVDDREVDAALERLLEDGRIVREEGRVVTYATTRAAERMVLPGWTARIGALNSLAGNVASVVYGRFFADAPESFARTLSFRLRREDLPKLKQLYDEAVWPRLEALDEASSADDEALAMNLTICWAEYASVPSPKPDSE